MAQTAINWSATENEALEPFGIGDSAFEKCELRLKKREKFDASLNRLIESESFWESFHPELNLEVNQPELCSSTNLETEDIQISVVVRDRTLNKFERVIYWPLWSVPKEPVSLKDSFENFSRSANLDICVLATPIETRDRGDGIAHNKSDVVARRVFKVRAPSQSSKIPYRWVSPDEFASRQVPPSTIWLVNWIGEDLERPPSDNVEILLNESFKEQFQVLDQGGDVANVFRREMSAAILTQFALRALEDKKPPLEELGMRKMMYDLMSRDTGLSAEEIFLRIEQPDSTGFVHAWAQVHVGLNEVLKHI